MGLGQSYGTRAPSPRARPFNTNTTVTTNGVGGQPAGLQESSRWSQTTGYLSRILRRAAKQRSELSPRRGFASLGVALKTIEPEPRSGDRIYIQRYFSSNSIP